MIGLSFYNSLEVKRFRMYQAMWVTSTVRLALTSIKKGRLVAFRTVGSILTPIKKPFVVLGTSIMSTLRTFFRVAVKRGTFLMTI